MVRKSKQAGGHNPLTYYERTKKFASSEYGTKQQRLAGHSQYQLGDCALSLTSLAVCGGGSSNNDGKVAASAATAASTATTTTTTTALCSPSGYLYAEDAILEYLLTKTRELKEQQAAFERQQAQEAQAKQDEESAARSKRKADFQNLHDSQTSTTSSSSSSQNKATTSSSSSSNKQPRLLAQHVKAQAQQELKRTSYWLAEAQPKTVDTSIVKQPVDMRPPSPHSQQPLRRKDLWPVTLQWTTTHNEKNSRTPPQLVCSVSGKVLHAQSVTAYWTTDNYKKMTVSSPSSSSHGPGKLVLTSVYQELIAGNPKSSGNNDTPKCPDSNRKIKATRELQKSGSSFAASGQAMQVAKYRPTIT